RRFQPNEVGGFAENHIGTAIAVQVRASEVEAGDRLLARARRVSRPLALHDRRSGHLNAMLGEAYRAALLRNILKPQDAQFAARACQDVEITVAVQIKGMRIDRYPCAAYLMLHPRLRVERVALDAVNQE